MVEAVATTAAVEVYRDGKSLFTTIFGKVNDAKNLKNNYNKLMNEVTKLYKKRNSVEAEASKDKMKQASKECEDWICSVKTIEEEVLELETKYEKLKRHIWFWSRSNLNKQIVDKTADIHRLRDQVDNFKEIVVERQPELVIVRDAPRTKYMPSSHGYVEQTVALLRDREIRIIGLWGMAGIGKTTIMQNLNDNEDIAKMFNLVISVSATSIEELQKVLIQRLELTMEGITDSGETAWRISEELKGRKYLLLLDEVGKVIDLHKSGINNTHVDGKVVLATRHRHICFDMDADEQINVQRLSDADAWKMFQEIVGPRKINQPGIEGIAEHVVLECAGWPLLIDRVARTFKRKDNTELWSVGLDNLRRWHSIEIQGMHEALQFLRFCYDHLNKKDSKDCFLYSALYSEDCEIYIDYLLECWSAEGLVHCDKGHKVLDDLIEVSLLERSKKITHIRMNKVLRKMALGISSERKDSKFLVRAGVGLLEPPNGEEWKAVQRISLMDNKLRELPKAPDCKKLSTLFLQRNPDLTILPNAFFGSMRRLRVLDLHDTGITSLPTSLSFLKCLKALFLNSCKDLKELPQHIKALEDLEVLDIRGTGINNFHHAIRGLNQLRRLRISLSNFGAGQSGNVNMNGNIISKFSLLEDLSIEVDPNNQGWDQVAAAITPEVATLKKLSSLSFCFPGVDCLKIFIERNQLWRGNSFKFQFSVGSHVSARFEILDYFECQMYKCLKLVGGNGVDPAISEVLAETYAFELIGHRGVSKLSDFGIKRLNAMRGCLIEGCDDIKIIIDGNTTTTGALKCLEKMYIKNVPELESIWEGPVHGGSLTNVITLELCKCPKLTKIFSQGMIRQLSALQHLRVAECPEIEELIMESENQGLGPDALSGLKTLVLHDLPKLRSIGVNDTVKWSSVERIQITTCNSLTSLPSAFIPKLCANSRSLAP